MTCKRCNHTARKFGRYGKRNTQRYRCSTCKATFSEYEPKLGTHYTDPETASKALAMMLEDMSVSCDLPAYRIAQRHDSLSDADGIAASGREG